MCRIVVDGRPYLVNENQGGVRARRPCGSRRGSALPDVAGSRRRFAEPCTNIGWLAHPGRGGQRTPAP